MKTIHGFELLVDPVKDSGVERDLYYLGTYEQGTLNIIQKILTPGDVFVDIGANIGLMTVFASHLVGPEGKVCAFEANPETKKILDFNVNLNGITNVITSGYAVGAENGNAKIFPNWNVNRGAASLIQSGTGDDYFPVEVIRFDQFKEIDPSKVSLMKIDIEGFEFEALKGCGNIFELPYPPIIIIECSNAGNLFKPEKGDVLEYLKKMNKYHFYVLEKGSQRESSLVEIYYSKQAPAYSNIFCIPQEKIENLPKNIFK